MIALVDYGAGNVKSVARALRAVGGEVHLTADPQQIIDAERVVFPGQGHFGQAMQRLEQSGLSDAIRQAVAGGRPFLGICLGLQLLFEGSDEAPGARGLGLLPGRCVRFGEPLKVPQIGWNEVSTSGDDPVLSVIDGGYMYFVHSYFAPASDHGHVAATSDYGGPFAAAVRRDNVLATQFHPEKSGRLGLALLRRWLESSC